MSTITLIQDSFVDNKEFIFSCFKVSLTTAVLLVVLEFLLWDKAWKEKIKKKENWELYKQGIETNLVRGQYACLCYRVFVS